MSKNFKGSERFPKDFKGIQDASRRPRNLPKRLQDGPQSAQDASKALQEETPGRLQELSRRGFGASEMPPRALQRRRSRSGSGRGSRSE